MKNIAASVQARLRNLARQRHKDYVLISRFTSRPTIDFDLLGMNIPRKEDQFCFIITDILSIDNQLTVRWV